MGSNGPHNVDHISTTTKIRTYFVVLVHSMIIPQDQVYVTLEQCSSRFAICYQLPRVCLAHVCWYTIAEAERVFSERIRVRHSSFLLGYLFALTNSFSPAPLAPVAQVAPLRRTIALRPPQKYASTCLTVDCECFVISVKAIGFPLVSLFANGGRWMHTGSVREKETMQAVIVSGT